MLTSLLLVLAGMVIATAVMAVGIGGGILWTPILILGLGLSPQEAVATALFIQVIGMSSGTLAYARAGLVEWRLTLSYFLIAAPGVIIGGFLSFELAPDTVQMALGIMAMTLAVLFVASQDEFDAGNKRIPHDKALRLAPIPAFFGLLMGALSVGISEWLVPALKSRLQMDMRRAVATVVPMMFLLAIVASVVHGALSQQIHTDVLLWGGLGTFIGGQLGARLSRHINERILKHSFIYLMTLIGIHLIFQAT